MAKKKTSITITLLYFVIFLSPLALAGASQQIVILWSTFAYVLGAAAMIFLYFRNHSKIEIEQEGKLTSPVFILLLGISGIFIALILQALIMGIQMAITNTQPSSENTESIISVIVENKLFILATAIGGPIMEEFVFRRSLIDLFTFPKTGFWLAAVISSILFSVIHMDGNYFVYFFLGLFFTILYKMTGKIWTSVIAHCGMNTLVIILQLIVHYGLLDLPQ
ncbi:CPBP family intramembrane metalloprotease [Enterococcus sp. BWB1-3]|uniref:CPBP family intramembrane glutamic endopeptidase n=1 Tax=unclassified Enterococcus TaxID=2608891 RepID=UPI0019238738|nr:MULTISPECIES: type II CAAX endopeptidase family protein [unclassified Enterococcus]MBL1228089.1 CPBP family intramembrane metalloprotease [Enterococcus sp. BWB1-3]MCB5951914.1 CPBP family intramembrane metalloprotease [Enterococcus sp. BWT-B8]MCB5954110.1 CPBP family intramembrane metalloprotease [Enterococcus sp. CWB-B31]